MVRMNYYSWMATCVGVILALARLSSGADEDNSTISSQRNTTNITGCACADTDTTQAPVDLEPDSPLKAWVRLKNSRNYDYGLTPMDTASDPVNVTINMEVGNMLDLNEEDMDFSLDIYLRQIWTDHRLSFADTIPNVSSIGIPDQYYDDIWLPDTFLENGKYEALHVITMANRMFRIRNDGTIWYSQRLRLVMWCTLRLHRFPLDSQICGLRFASYRYTTNEVVLTWHPHEAVNFGSHELAMFYYIGHTLGDCTASHITGTFSCVYINVHFDRRFGFYLVQVYVPSILIVMLSWVSFWLDPHSVPARISVGILTILAMTNQLSAVAADSLPKVSYIKAMDIWLTCCMTFLCASVLEFAVANTFARHFDTHTSQQASDNRYSTPTRRNNDAGDLYVQTVVTRVNDESSSIPMCPNCDNFGRRHVYNVQENGFHPKAKEQRPPARHCCVVADPLVVDHVARVLFPLAFSLFNVVYWSVYLT